MKFVRQFAAILVFSTAAIAQNPRWYPDNLNVAPTARLGEGMAYDSSHSQTVVFGGMYPSPLGPTMLADTWMFGAGTWSQIHPATSPPPRCLDVLVYDSGNHNMVLFGGYQFLYNLLVVPLGDTWIWDGTDWSQRFPTNSPSPRYGYGMVYDAARGQTVLFGGNNTEGSLGDTWVWDGVNWTQKFPANSPSARYSPSMTYDTVRGQTVLFGGTNLSDSFSDTWAWDGANWTQLSPSTTPPARFGAAMSFHIAEGHAILFGGTNQSGNMGDTWVWDGTTWTQQLAHALLAPSARFFAGMDYDASAGQIVLFGGGKGIPRGDVFLGDTWLWH